MTYQAIMSVYSSSTQGLSVLSWGLPFCSMSGFPSLSTKAPPDRSFSQRSQPTLKQPAIAVRWAIDWPCAKTARYTTFATITSWGGVGTIHRFNDIIKNPASKALSEIRTLAWWWKLSKTISRLKVSLFDSMVYELVDELILSSISSSVQGAKWVIGPVLSFRS